jgi:hypothetical protein
MSNAGASTPGEAVPTATDMAAVGGITLIPQLIEMFKWYITQREGLLMLITIIAVFGLGVIIASTLDGAKNI